MEVEIDDDNNKQFNLKNDIKIHNEILSELDLEFQSYEKINNFKNSKKTKIIIIGSGCAGLTANYKLDNLSKDFEILILEASNEVGGRAKTINLGGVPVDIGCCWLEGHIKNPITELAMKLDYKLTYGFPGNGQRFDFDGSKIDHTTIKNVNQVYSYLMDNLEDTKLLEDICIHDLFKKLISNSICDLSDKEKRFLNFYISSIEQYEGASICELSVNNYDANVEFPGDHKFVRGGYGNLIKELSKNANICFNSFVTKVDYNDNNNINVTFNLKNLTNNGEVIEKEFNLDCKYCICTASLGVLQSGKIKFSPTLGDKQKLIDKLGMGLMNKIVVKFKKSFWDPSVGVFNYIGEEKGEFRFIINYNLHYPGSNILICLTTADFAKKLEKLNDQEVLNLFFNRLKIMFKIEDIEYEDYFITKWGTNEFTLGSYSFMKVNCSLDDFSDFSIPIQERLFFAGEHTTVHFSHLHSAYISGEKVAEQIVKLNKIC